MFFKSRSGCSLSSMPPAAPSSSSNNPEDDDVCDITRGLVLQLRKHRGNKTSENNKQKKSKPRGDNVLHWTVQSRPDLDAVQTLVKASPSLATQPNEKGNLPLHTAIENKASFAVIQELVQTYPESVGIANNDKMYPLHILCNVGGSIETIQCLLQAPNGSKCLVKKDGSLRQKPLHILNARKEFQKTQNVIQSMRDSRHTAIKLQSELQQLEDADVAVERCNEIKKDLALIEPRIQENQDNEFWQKAKLLILAEYMYSFHGKNSFLSSSSSEHNDTIQMVHACAAIKNCPPSLLDFAMLLNPSAVLEADKEGNLPLHIAAMYSDSLTVSELLLFSPQAALVTNDKGKYPLQLLLENGNPKWEKGGVKLLVAANPMALQGLDLNDELYPHVLAKCMTTKKCGHSAVFALLRTKPTIFASSN